VTKYWFFSYVIASHIFQHRWRLTLPFLSQILDIKDVNDVRNGLFLYKPVEWAFDRAKIFIEMNETVTGSMLFRLLDQDLRDVKLADKASELRMEGKRERPPVGREASLQTTFGDLDGQNLHFPPNSDMRPSKRLLAIHAYAAWIKFMDSCPFAKVAAPLYKNDLEDGLGSIADAFSSIVDEIDSDKWKMKKLT
jgi:hypothetical protein